MEFSCYPLATCYHTDMKSTLRNAIDHARDLGELQIANRLQEANTELEEIKEELARLNGRAIISGRSVERLAAVQDMADECGPAIERLSGEYSEDLSDASEEIKIHLT